MRPYGPLSGEAKTPLGPDHVNVHSLAFAGNNRHVHFIYHSNHWFLLKFDPSHADHFHPTPKTDAFFHFFLQGPMN
jgi:hypothetical protein